jgi:hypothetical protein
MYVMSYSKRTDLGVKKRTMPRQITLGPTALKFIAVVIFAALGVIYLTTSTSGANRSVEVRNITAEQDNLQQKIDLLNAEGSRLRSLNNVYNQTSTGLTPGGTVNYIQDTNQPVAKK